MNDKDYLALRRLVTLYGPYEVVKELRRVLSPYGTAKWRLTLNRVKQLEYAAGLAEGKKSYRMEG